jgi:hypothetical protein
MTSIGCIWFGHCATSRKVMGSIPTEGIEFFNYLMFPATLLALESTQPLTEMSARTLSGGKGQPVC